MRAASFILIKYSCNLIATYMLQIVKVFLLLYYSVIVTKVQIFSKCS